MQLADLTQQPRKLTQQLPCQQFSEAPTEQLLGGVNQIPSPLPPTLCDLLNLLDSVVESSLLQAPPLQPMEPTLNQDSVRDTCSLFSAVSVQLAHIS